MDIYVYIVGKKFLKSDHNQWNALQIKGRIKIESEIAKKKWTIAKCKCKFKPFQIQRGINLKTEKNIKPVRIDQNGLIKILPMEVVYRSINQIHLKSNCLISDGVQEKWREGNNPVC